MIMDSMVTMVLWKVYQERNQDKLRSAKHLICTFIIMCRYCIVWLGKSQNDSVTLQH